MRKFLLSSILVVLTASFQTPIKELICPEKPISKTINFKIAPAATYQHKAYAHSFAALHITVIKLKGNRIDTLIEKEYPDFKLSKLTSYSKEFHQIVRIPKVVDSKEQIIFLYNVTYKSKGSSLKVPNANWITRGTTESDIQISI